MRAAAGRIPVWISRLRQEYMRAGLHEKDLQADPLAQFGNWFDEALQSGIALPNAMTLATATKKGVLPRVPCC